MSLFAVSTQRGGTSGSVVGGVAGVLCADLAIVEFGGASTLREECLDHVEFSDLAVLTVWPVIIVCIEALQECA